MPQQISKTISFMLFDEEVEAWQTLENYLLKKNLITYSQVDTKKVGAKRVIRGLMQLMAEQLAAEIGPEVAEKLAIPLRHRSPGRPHRTPGPGNAKPGAKPRGRPPVQKPKPEPEPEPTHRIAWDRPWKPRPGDAE